MDVRSYTSLNLQILDFVGLYPINNVKYFISFSCIFLIVIPQIIELWNSRRDFIVILETSSVLSTIVLALLKSLVWYAKKKNLEPFIKFMLTDYWQIACGNHFNYLDTYASVARKITKGYLFLICNALLFFFTVPIFVILINSNNVQENNVKHFPFPASYPLTWYNSPVYEIVYVSQMLATGYCGLVILSTDSLIATALFHTCAHFKIIQMKIEQISGNVKDIHHIKKEFSKIVLHHQTVLRFCDKMEELFGPILFLQTLASSLIICLVGFQVSNTYTKQYKLFEYSSYLLMAIFQLLLFSIPGDDLICQSKEISHVVYSINWYEYPVAVKNEVITIMVRGQKPSCITAAKFYVMHLENFSSVLSTSLSYFMVLRSLNSDATS